MSGVADFLSGMAGSPIDRGQLNSMVATSQARNGLVSAQTQDAMLKAQQMQEQQDAYESMGDKIQAAFPDVKPSEAELMKNIMISHFGGDPEAAVKAHALIANMFGNQQQQAAGQRGYSGKPNEPMALPDNFAMAPGAAPITPQQTAHGEAVTNDVNSQAALRDAQTSAGGFNPHTTATGGALDPQMIDYGAYMLYRTGQMPPMGMGNGPARSAFISGAAKLAQREADGENVTNPGYEQAIANKQDFGGAQKAINSVAGGPLGNQARGINNITGHLQLMEQLFTGLQNGDTQLVNSLKNKWNKFFGSEAPTDVQTAATFIGPELVKLLNNSTAGEKDERAAFGNSAANLANAPEQTTGAIHTLKGMLGRQATDLALQYHGATGRGDFAKRYIAKDVSQYLELERQDEATGGDAGGAGGAGGTPVQITSDADYMKLPSGTPFTAPDGSHRVKP